MKNNINSSDVTMTPESSKAIVMQDGKTTYILNLYFRTDTADSLEDKVKRLIRKALRLETSKKRCR